MSNILSELTSFTTQLEQCKEVKSNSIINKVLMVCKEYMATLTKYSDLTSNDGPIYNIIHNSKVNEQITKLLNIILNTEHSDYIDDRNKEDSDNDNLNNVKPPNTEYIENLKKVSNLLIDQLSKIQRREMINEGVEIMMKQININKEQATQFLVENNLDPVDALLAFMNHKPVNEAKTYFTFQLNQHELVNELVSMSDKLNNTNFYDKSSMTELMKRRIQSFVCIKINTENDLHKVKKYSSVPELYTLFISDNYDNIKIAQLSINNEKFGLLYSTEYITSSINENIKYPVNNPITVVLRNIGDISNEDFYCGSALFVNNFFLN
jgi:hypothetical protein